MSSTTTSAEDAATAVVAEAVAAATDLVVVPGEATAPTVPDVRVDADEDDETATTTATAVVADVVAALADHLSDGNNAATTTPAAIVAALPPDEEAALHGLVDCASHAAAAVAEEMLPPPTTSPTKLPPPHQQQPLAGFVPPPPPPRHLEEKMQETTTTTTTTTPLPPATTLPPPPPTVAPTKKQSPPPSTKQQQQPALPFDPSSEPTVQELIQLRFQVSKKELQVGSLLNDINAHTLTIRKLKRQYKEAKQTRATKQQQKKQQQQRMTANTPRPTKASHDPSSSSCGNTTVPTDNPLKVNVQYGTGTSKTGSKLREQKWKEKFQELVAYKLQHGDCVVPKSYKNKSLHHWVRKQRVCKKDFDSGMCGPEAMTQERINALDSIGFAWHVGHQPKDAQWEANFQELLTFRQRHGHFRIPATSAKLHKWVLNQRCRRRLLEQKGEGQARGMTWARVEKLNAIGFVWDGKKGY